MNNDKNYLRLDCMSNNEKLNHIYDNYGFELKNKGKVDGYNYSLRELKID